MLEGLLMLSSMESGNMWTRVSVVEQNKTGYCGLRESSWSLLACLFTYLLTYLLIPWSSDLLEKL